MCDAFASTTTSTSEEEWIVEIGVFGATGAIGRCVVAEASSRGHRVTAFTSDPSRIPTCTGRVTWRVVEVLDAGSGARAIDGLDVVINAIKSGRDMPDMIANAGVLPAAARMFLKALEQHPSTRLITRFRIGDDQFLVATDGTVSDVTAEHLAAALVDVAEMPRQVHRHFTAGI